MMLVRPLLFVLALASSALAQSAPPEYLRFLPITRTDLPGANGSLWVTEHYAHNHSDDRLWITNARECRLSATHACDTEIAPRSTVRIGAWDPADPYDFWVVTEGPVEAFSISSFVRNVSSEVDPWGTAIPIPRPGDFRTQPLHLAPIPADPDYRISLRVYAWSWVLPADIPELLVEVWNTNEFGHPTTLVTTLALGAYPDPSSRLPGSYFEAHDLLSPIAERTADARVLLKLSTPSAPAVRLWGFASIVHNETQHVTVFAP